MDVWRRWPASRRRGSPEAYETFCAMSRGEQRAVVMRGGKAVRTEVVARVGMVGRT
jgi:hypothetical protein